MDARPRLRMTPKQIARINILREKCVGKVVSGLVGLDASLAYLAKVPVDLNKVASWRRSLAAAVPILARVRRQLRRVRTTDTGRAPSAPR